MLFFIVVSFKKDYLNQFSNHSLKFVFYLSSVQPNARLVLDRIGCDYRTVWRDEGTRRN